MASIQDGVAWTSGVDDNTTELGARNDAAAAAGGGASGEANTSYQLISAANTNATVVKNSAGTIGSIQLVGNTATPYYVKFYNKATAPTVGTDVPIKTLVVPANSTNGAGSNVALPPGGMEFTAGISLAITGAATVADTSACAANAVVVNLEYV